MLSVRYALQTRLDLSRFSTRSSESPLRNFLFMGVFIRGLYHATCMALEFVIECQSSLTMRELSLSVTVCHILRGNFMYKSFIHATDEVFEVPFPGPSIPSLNFVCVPCHSETGKGSSTEIYPHGVLMVSSYIVHSEPME